MTENFWRSAILPAAVVGLFLLLVWYAVSSIWSALNAADDKVAIAIIAGFFSVIGATVTVMLGRYYERKREIEAHFREKKIEIYDEFLKELFTLFQNAKEGGDARSSDDLVKFLQDWQRTLVLWGGQGVLSKYFAWMVHLKGGKPNAETMFLMDDFFRALRADIGQSSFLLSRGSFAHLILRNSSLFLDVARKKPDLTFEEFAEIERKSEASQ